MSDFINNPGGLTQAVRTPEVRAQAEYTSRGLTSRIATMHKKGLSFSPATDTFVDADGIAHYDKQGVKIAQVAKKEPSLHARSIEAPPQRTTTGASNLPSFIAPPVEQAPQHTVESVIHFFKVYDPIQQQILQTILTQ